MTPKARLLALLLPIFTGCGTNEGPSLTASDVSILAPLPGQDAAVAYLTLRNQGPAPLVVSQVSSPEFATVEMHATVFGEGMAEMIRIDSITIAADSEIEFTTGGSHFMLMDPQQSLAPGDHVALELHYGHDRPLIVRAPLRGRTNTTY